MIASVVDTDRSSVGLMIERYFHHSSEIGCLATSTSLPEAIIEEVVGSGKVRSGPRPSPESMIAMGNTIARYIKAGEPIPFIVPWGPKKPVDSADIDLAEYGALLALLNLNERVRQHYSPGIVARIRVEDLCGFYLLRESGEDAVAAISRYVSSFERLAGILGNGVTIPVRESVLADYQVYAAIADSLAPHFFQYIADTDQTGLENYDQHADWKELAEVGWQGEIPHRQREYYRSRYRALYPGQPEEKYTAMLAEYFAYTMTRGILGTYGGDQNWGTDFLQVNFTTPVPGAPLGMIERKVHYRTFPASITKDRIPPWKAKGYFVSDSVRTIPATASWHEQIEYRPCQTKLTGDDGTTVMLQTDYTLA